MIAEVKRLCPLDPGFRESAVFPDGEIGTAMLGKRNRETGEEERGSLKIISFS